MEVIRHLSTQPFDSLIFKYWSLDHVRNLEMILNGSESYAVVEALVPNKRKAEYFKDNILHDTLMELYNSPNLCDKHKYCKDVIQHSVGFACVTAAGITKKLSDYFSETLRPLDNLQFKDSVMRYVSYNVERKNIGVLVFDFEHNVNNLRNHAMKVLYDNFYVYTTPIINSNTPNAATQFIIKQISRNTDCAIIFVDNNLSNSWFTREDNVEKILLRCLGWDFKIKVIIVSLFPEADRAASDIFINFINLKPALVLYQQFIFAPSGGLIALVEKSCKLNLTNRFLKYWYRGTQAFKFFDIDDGESKSTERIQLV